MAESEEAVEVVPAKVLRLCINETSGVNIVRVELHGIARFACWWFVVLSMIAVLVSLPALFGSHW